MTNKNKHFIYAGLIAVVYVVIWRPIRSYLAQNVFLPLYSGIGTDSWSIYSAPKSVSIVFERLGTDTVGIAEFAFGTPWGFYLFLPLVVLVAFKKSQQIIYLHLVIQVVLGLLAALFVALGLTFTDLWLHLFRLTTSYLTPGFAFILLFLAFFKSEEIIKKKE